MVLVRAKGTEGVLEYGESSLEGEGEPLGRPRSINQYFVRQDEVSYKLAVSLRLGAAAMMSAWLTELPNGC